jgi:hypothetical protein
MTPANEPRYEPATDSECKHHWLIASPSGPTSEGRCKLCGIQRSFYNVFEDVIQPREPKAA